MAIQNPGRRHLLADLYLHLAVVVGAFNMVTAQAPPPPQLHLLRATTSHTVPTTVITIAIIAFFVLLLFCVLVNQWRSSSEDADAIVGGGQGYYTTARRRGLDAAAVAALPIVPYAEIMKHKSSGGGLECAVCLAAFSDGDELRLLPQCFHAFHQDCIDPWLEDHVTCPLCRVNLEKPPPPAAVAVRMEVVENADEGRREEQAAEAVELQKLRCVRRAVRMMLRSSSTGHSVSTAVVLAAETGDRERFTVRLPPHVLEEVLESRRLRHATSLVVRLGGASSCEGSPAACAVGGERCHGARRRWPSFLARTTSWAHSFVAEGSPRRGGVGVGPAEPGTRKSPCGHGVCSTAARWPARCKARNLA